MRSMFGKSAWFVYLVRIMKKLIFCFLLVCGAAVAAPTNDGMYATMQTTMGDVCFELYYTNTPRTVANFVSLAEGTRPWIDPRTTFVSNNPYYDGIIFHRAISNFMIQCGSPKGDGTDGPGYTFEDEFDPTLRHDRPGVVSMANSGPDSNGGQFFITVTNTAWLDDVHTVFGHVVEGMSVVSNIAAVATTNDKPLVDITITNLFITRNGTNALSFAVTNQSLPEVAAIHVEIDGLNLSAGTATSCYQYGYSSTNLSDWKEDVSDYWPVPDGNWNLTATDESQEYFHANRVVYPTDKNRTGSPISHRFVMDIDTGDTFTITPTGINNGGVMLNSGPNRSMTYWDWGANPFSVQFIVYNGLFYYRFDLYYTSPTGGSCDCYFYSSYWISLGSGTFTDENLNL